MKLPKRLGRMTGVRLAAIILAVMLISPGNLYSQGPRPGSRVQDGSQQADKSFIQEQQKKRQQLMKNRKKPQPPKKKKKIQPVDKPLRGGPVGQGVK